MPALMPALMPASYQREVTSELERLAEALCRLVLPAHFPIRDGVFEQGFELGREPHLGGPEKVTGGFDRLLCPSLFHANGDEGK